MSKYSQKNQKIALIYSESAYRSNCEIILLSAGVVLFLRITLKNRENRVLRTIIVVFTIFTELITCSQQVLVPFSGAATESSATITISSPRLQWLRLNTRRIRTSPIPPAQVNSFPRKVRLFKTSGKRTETRYLQLLPRVDGGY